MNLLPALVALTLAASASAEDLTITFKSSDGSTASHYFTKDRIRMNNGRSDSLLEFATGRIVNIDHEKKQYSEMTIAEMDEAMKGVAAQMEQAMAQVPPQMREQMAKMMGGGAPEPAVAKGAVKTIAGYSCQTYTVTMGANLTQESCHTTALTPPFDPAHFQKLSRITVPMIQGMDKLIQKMSEIQGVALAQRTTVSIMGRKTEQSLEATGVSKAAIAADVFTLPAGYKKVDSPLKNLGKMGGR